MSDSYKDDLGTQTRTDGSKAVDYTKLNYGLSQDEGEDGLKIVAVQKEVDGDVRAYMLSDGQVVSVQKAVDLCNQGQMDSMYITAIRWDGDAYIRTRPNSKRADNLSNLPEF